LPYKKVIMTARHLGPLAVGGRMYDKVILSVWQLVYEPHGWELPTA